MGTYWMYYCQVINDSQESGLSNILFYQHKTLAINVQIKIYSKSGITL